MAENGKINFPPEGEPFDVISYVETAKRKYKELGERVVRTGFNSNEATKIFLEPASIALDAVIVLAHEYEKESEPKKKETIAIQMQRAGASLEGRITGKVTRAAEEFKKAEVNAVANETFERVSDMKTGRNLDLDLSDAESAPVDTSDLDKKRKAEEWYSQGGSYNELSEMWGGSVPSNVVSEYDTLVDKVVGPLEVNAESKLAAIEALHDFILNQRMVAGAKEKSATVVPPTQEVAPTSSATGEERLLNPPGMDKGVLKAPQYGKGKMQEEMDALNHEEFVQPAPAAPEAEPTPEPEIAVETLVGGSDTTPKEEREKLRGLLGKFEALEKEKAEQPASAERGRVSFNEHTAQLTNRSNELNARAEKLGWIESSFRSLGEKYNKLSFIKKLGVGVALGLGAAVFSAVSIPTALIFTGGLAAQRAAGMASVFLKIEKHLQNKAGGMPVSKEKAMAGAMLYTAGMGYAIREAVEYVGETEFVHSIREWLKGHYPFGSAATPPPHTEAVPVAAATHTTELPKAPEVLHEHAADIAEIKQMDKVTAPVAPNEAVSAVTPEASISVEATPGHGYEFMTRQLWEQLQGKGLDPHQYAEGSDIRRLLETDQKSIDAVVHDLAKENKFFKPDGSSVQINLGDKMSFDAAGNLLLGENLLPPEDAGLTPPYHPEMSAPVESPLAHETVVTPEPIQTIEAPEYQNTTVEASPESAPPPPTSIVEHATAFVNHLNVPIDPTHGHVFKDTTGAAIAYGKDALDAAQKFAMDNPNTSVWVQADHPVSVGGVIRPYVFEVKYGGLIFKNMHIISPDVPADPNLIGAIDPETFVERLDK
ncbi:MAG: hypothetical protein NUV60_01385 [Patescibacteria group bacterium]|nr:hypothetical protein [Patescibacteria group bacterium]